LLETAVTFLGFHGLNWLQHGQLDAREGANYGPLVPFGRYRCRDADLMIGVSTKSTWSALCQVVGGGLDSHPDYLTNDLRFAHSAQLRAELEALLAERDCAEWARLLDEVGVPNAPVQTVDQVL